MVRIRSRSVPIKILILLSFWIISSVILYFPILPVRASQNTFGYTEIGELIYSVSLGEKHSIGYIAPENGILTSLTIYMAYVSPETVIRVAVYSNNVSGYPDLLLVESRTQEVVAYSWNTIPIATSLTKNCRYHFSWKFDKDTNVRYDGEGEGNWAMLMEEWNGFSDPYGEPLYFYEGCAWSVYGTYTTEEFGCNWIGTSTTKAGESATLSSNWEDLYNAEGLSQYRLLHNNTGELAWESWSSSWVSTYWAKTTLTLNSTEGLTIAFLYEANNTAGELYNSTWCFFTTPIITVYEGPFFGVTHRVDYGLTLLVVSAPERNPSFLEFLYDKVEIPVELIILNREDRSRYFYLSYTVLSESGELLKEGDLSLEIEPKAQQPVSFSFQVPYGKREAPKNFSVSLLANGGEDPIELDLTLSHSPLSFFYPLVFLVAIGLIIGVAYIIVKKAKREK